MTQYRMSWAVALLDMFEHALAVDDVHRSNLFHSIDLGLQLCEHQRIALPAACHRSIIVLSLSTEVLQPFFTFNLTAFYGYFPYNRSHHLLIQ
jgi:hypothetical protein